MSLDDICSNCRDVVMYCECWIPKDKHFSDSRNFTLGDGQRKILWNSETRQLEGDQELIEQIRSKLNGRQETICDVGTIWMDEREPIAVTFLASSIELTGFSSTYGPYVRLKNT